MISESSCGLLASNSLAIVNLHGILTRVLIEMLAMTSKPGGTAKFRPEQLFIVQGFLFGGINNDRK